MPKYSQEIIFNDDEVYDFLFDPRGIPKVEQYATKTFSKNIAPIINTNFINLSYTFRSNLL